MIKLLLLLFIFSSVYAQETLFKLPDNHSRFLHHLHLSLKNASRILIVSQSYNHPLFSKELLASLKRGTRLNLIVKDPNLEPLSLVQYKNVELYLTAEPVNQSVIVIDDTLACTTAIPIDEELFRSERTFIRCEDDPLRITSLVHTLKPLMNPAENYLK